jgi:hypothetical protein
MRVYSAPNPGDPGLVCTTDDAAHRNAAEARKLEREHLLADAAKPKDGPTDEEIAAVVARERPDVGARKDAHE